MKKMAQALSAIGGTGFAAGFLIYVFIPAVFPVMTISVLVGVVGCLVDACLD